MKRTLFLLGLLILVLAFVVGCGGTDDDDEDVELINQDADRVIRLGASASLSGGQAAFGQGIVFGNQAAVDDINALGGVYVEEYGRKLLVELIIQDNETDAVKASSSATDLILRFEVDALVGGMNPPTTYNPISVVADRFETPAILGSPFENWWGGGPYEYAWSSAFRLNTPIPDGHPLAGLPGYTAQDVILDALIHFIDQTNGVMGLFTNDDVDGRGWYQTYSQTLINRGYPPQVGHEEMFGLYPPGTSDFSPIIAGFIENDVEIVLGALPGADAAVFLRQSEQMGFKPKVVIASGAGLFHSDVASWGGDLPNGVMVSTWWDSTYPYEFAPGIGDTTGADLARRWTEETGDPLNRVIGPAYANVQIILDAIERAGTLDKAAVNKAIGETDLATIAHPRAVFTDTNDNPFPMFIGQWFKTDTPEVWVNKLVYSPHDWYETQVDPLFPRP